jgi:hypothetical protein
VTNNRRRTNGSKGTPSRGPSSPRKSQTPASSGAGIRSDIYGIVLTVIAIALVIAVLSPEQAWLPGIVAGALGQLLGLGRYVVALFVLLWAVSFFFERFEYDELRIGGGLTLSFLAIIAMIALSAPRDATFWATETLVTRGGYIGGGIAFGLGAVLGQVIAYVVLAGALVIGLVLATGTKVADAYRLVADFVAPPGDEAAPRRAVRPGAKTLPLADLDADVAFDSTPEPAARKGRDPEAERRTIPTPRAVAPRKLDGFVRRRSPCSSRPRPTSPVRGPRTRSFAEPPSSSNRHSRLSIFPPVSRRGSPDRRSRCSRSRSRRA